MFKSGLFPGESIKMSFSRPQVYILIFLLFLIRIVSMSFHQALVEEAYYWNYAMHLDWSYLDHPPMVAIMIYLSRMILGDHEWTIRLPALMCWMGTAYYSYRLTEIIQKKSGLYAVLFVSILPYFFLQSMFMTPDLPLMLFWSATLYYLYRSIVFNEKRFFFAASISLGLGLLSKYTILLLAPATLIFITMVPDYRIWWKCKELYLGAIIVLVLFSPVIYWNVTHEWASFVFQSTQRIHDTRRFSTPILILILILFLMPTGIWALWDLFKKGTQSTTRFFFKIYTLFPLSVFAIFSLHNQIKFNWIGTLCLALIPWFSILLEKKQFPKRLLFSLWALIPTYLLSMTLMISAKPALIYPLLFHRYPDWQGVSISLNQLAQSYEIKEGTVLTILPMDKYNMASELDFYQHKAFQNQKIKKVYPILGQHVLGNPSLMYRFWDKAPNHHGEKVLLVAWKDSDLDLSYLNSLIQKESEKQSLWVYDPRHHYRLFPIYYLVAVLI